MVGTKPCIFCGRTGVRLTREHAIPRWVSKALQTREHGGVTQTLGPDGRDPRHVAELDLKVREVCAPCNNGWLAELERFVRSILANPIRGLPLTKPIPVSAHRRLAVWALKTWLLAQHVSGSRPGNTPFALQPDILQHLRQHNEPPDLTGVWIGAVNATETLMVMRLGTVRVMDSREKIVGLLGVFTVGCVFFAVYMPSWLRTDPRPEKLVGMGLTGEPASHVIELWPSLGEPIPWPAKPVMSVADVERFWPSKSHMHIEGLTDE